MSLTNEQIVDAVAGKTLMEVMELVKAIEEKFGVTAAAPVMMAGPAAAAEVNPEGCRREEGRRHQGCPRHHRPGPEGSQGPHRGRRRPEGSRVEGRRREVQEGTGSRRRVRRAQVIFLIVIPDSARSRADPGSSVFRKDKMLGPRGSGGDSTKAGGGSPRPSVVLTGRAFFAFRAPSKHVPSRHVLPKQVPPKQVDSRK
jgi:Ribosomal protein L7/L12 dimerisation domain